MSKLRSLLPTATRRFTLSHVSCLRITPRYTQNLIWRQPSTFASSRSVYHERVIEQYENPKNVGSLNAEDPNVGTGLVGAPACGDVMKLQVRIQNGVIEEAVFKTFGCGSAIASSSLATEWIKGKSIEDAKSIRNKDIAKHLSLPPVKLHCSMLAEDAIKASIRNYEEKQEKIQKIGCCAKNSQ